MVRKHVLIGGLVAFVILAGLGVGLYFWLRPKHSSEPNAVNQLADCGASGRKCPCGQAWNGTQCVSTSNQQCTYNEDCGQAKPWCVNGRCTTSDALTPACDSASNCPKNASVSGRCAEDAILFSDNMDKYLASEEMGQCLPNSGECALSTDCPPTKVCGYDKEKQIISCVDPSTTSCDATNASQGTIDCYNELQADVPLECQNGHCARAASTTCPGGGNNCVPCLGLCELVKDTNGNPVTPYPRSNCAEHLVCLPTDDPHFGRCACKDPSDTACFYDNCSRYYPNLCEDTGNNPLKCTGPDQCNTLINGWMSSFPGVKEPTTPAPVCSTNNNKTGSNGPAFASGCFCTIPCVGDGTVCPMPGWSCEGGLCSQAASKINYITLSQCNTKADCDSRLHDNGEPTVQKCNILNKDGSINKECKSVPAVYTQCSPADKMGPYADLIADTSRNYCTPPMMELFQESHSILWVSTKYLGEAGEIASDIAGSRKAAQAFQQLIGSETQLQICPGGPWRTSTNYLWQEVKHSSGTIFYKTHKEWQTYFCELVNG